jgi:2-amino-4-hydroxy-6-hydroxymethyldihydropteridine diphosphokinase
MHQVLLSLGANLGSPLETLSRAIELIGTHILHNVRVSSFYETAPVGFADQPAFINVALIGTTQMCAADIHAACKDLEQQLGRQHRQQWHEREIDIDVILVGSELYDHNNVTVPHKRMHERMFVLLPACEVAPDMVCPRTDKPLSQLLAECTDTVSNPKRVASNSVTL